MSKWMQLLWIYLLLPAFVVSSTGFRLVKHDCTTCNSIEYAFNDSFNCCNVETTPVHSCCMPFSGDTASCEGYCCEELSEYFVTDQTVSPNLSKVSFSLLHPFEVQTGYQPLIDNPESSVIKYSEGYFPYKHSGKQLLVLIKQLKYDCLPA